MDNVHELEINFFGVSVSVRCFAKAMKLIH